ncbi:MAG: T9SS type A sorting domain-containing protein, partial [Candidatus Latescibacteria bacterium]|nr:T9SS type A sorting domain-containing protein [Candidatus Latescibacterota bacterium]
WIAQSPHTIRWEDEGFFETVNIEFSSDSGTTWSTIAENIDAAAGSYEWTPEKASDECLLRIVNAENSGVLDATDEPFTIYGPTESIETKPLEFSVSQNSPNPFNPSTTISYIIPEPEQVTLEIYNVAGQKVITLVDSFMDSGQHEIVWDASDYSSGLYICRVSAGQFSGFKKMLLMK